MENKPANLILALESRRDLTPEERKKERVEWFYNLVKSQEIVGSTYDHRKFTNTDHG